MLRRASILLIALFVSITLYLYLPFSPSGNAEAIRSSLQYDGRHTNAETDFALPLRTAGRHIVDANGQRVKLASVNWYGASDKFFVAGGLDFRHRDEIAATIKKMGFNSVRFPYSDQMVLDNPVIAPEVISANLDLLDGYDMPASDHRGSDYTEDLRRSDGARGPRAMDVFVATVEAMTNAGLAVIINNHITNAAWCDGKNLCDSSWKNSHLRPFCKIDQTTESWIENWQTVMKPFVSNPLVIGADLRNEPRGFWGTMTWNMWATAAEKAAEALHTMQPDWLMFIEGISSANDVSGAHFRPVRLQTADRIVYSAHVYSWSGWSTLVSYSSRAYPSFEQDMDRNWAYLLRGNIAPVWVGEFGAPSNAGEGDRHYWDNLMTILRETDADFGYWALNPRKPDGYDNETYGLLRDDWETPIEDYRMADLRKLMRPVGEEQEGEGS